MAYFKSVWRNIFTEFPPYLEIFESQRSWPAHADKVRKKEGLFLLSLFLHRPGSSFIEEERIVYQYFWRDQDDGLIWPSDISAMAIVHIIHKAKNLLQNLITALLRWDSETTTASIFVVFIFVKFTSFLWQMLT